MNNNNLNKLKEMNHNKKTYKKGVKKILLMLVCLIPVILLTTVLMAELKLPEWIAVIVNISVGGFVCLIVYIISDRIEHKKALKEIANPDPYDPFKD